ncbi:MAG: saccharopine dehydrogenase family protein [Gammaproteobacteria bacterium]
MRYLILGGCGAIGSEVVEDLVGTANFDALTIADVDGERLTKAARRYLDSRVTTMAVSPVIDAELSKLMKRHDVIVNCTPGDDNVSILNAAITGGVRYMDITGSMLAEERLALDSKAKEAGVMAVIAMGASPGLTNAAAAHGAQQLDRVDDITIEYASLRPMNPSAGLLDTAIRQYTPYVRCPVFDNGKLRYEPTFSGAHEVEFPPPIGRQTLYYTPHSEVVTLSRYIPNVKRVRVFGTYHPTVMAALRVFRDHGLMESQPISINGAKTNAREILTRVLSGRDIPFPGPTHYCLRIAVSGEKDGAEVSHTYTLTFDEHGPRAGQLPQIWMTAVGASVGAQILAQCKIPMPGVMAPEACIDPDAYLQGAAARDIIIDWTTHAVRPVRAAAKACI